MNKEILIQFGLTLLFLARNGAQEKGTCTGITSLLNHALIAAIDLRRFQ